MCGVCGVFARDGAPVDQETIERMRDAVRHRGPDDCGVWMRPDRRDVGLGHRRLAIVDLSPSGRGPMANEDGTVQVTYNGEIYNHRELRRDLERRGHRFRTNHCDTEVLVHLYEEYGERMVDHLIGMFAFGIWDERDQSLLLARDRLGIKPLYWTDQGSRFAFGSEIKSLVELLPRREIDPEAFSHYLTFVAVPPPRTLFAGVQKLAPATTLRVTRHGPQKPVRYWDPLVNAARLDLDSAGWEAELRFRLERSVDRRMMSDVPVGVFLSGGVDSSTNVALMSRLTEQPVNTFSIAFRGTDAYDETPWARRVAEQFGTNHHETRIDADDLWELMPQLVHHQDEPIADPVCVPLYFVSQLAKEHGVTVVHVGEGADELLAGYPTYLKALQMAEGPWRRLLALPEPARKALSRVSGPAAQLAPRYEIHAEALGRIADPRARLWWGGAVAFYPGALERLTTSEFRRAATGDGPANLVAQIAADADAGGARDELDRLIYQDLRIRLPELLLMRVDKLTMAHAVEARVPFLDHELVELAMGMPAAEKIADGEGKVILKRAMRDLLPHDLLWRRKQGFGAPVAQWFRGDLAERVVERIDASAVHELGWLDRDRIRQIAALHASGRADRSFQLWNLLNLSFWFDHWIAGREDQA